MSGNAPQLTHRRSRAVMLLPMRCSSDMRRLTLLISVALASVALAVPATASAKRSHNRTHKARVADRNHNGMPDSWERKFRVHKASADPDRDGVTNIGEFHNGTNPRSADSNGNGIPDGQDDVNDDGVPDGQEQAGTISSFDGTTLVITLVNGSTEQGTVNGDTEIECEDSAPAPATASTRDGGDDSTQSGDQTQSGEDNQTSATPPTTSGDDENQGDDDQGDNNDDQGESSGSCGTDALAPTTIVKEAELKLTSAGAVFHSIHLGGKAPA